jgi:putative phage-type endonuclease
MNKKVLKLFNLPQPPQRSKEWFIQRNRQITASEVASCLFLKKEVIEVFNETFPKAILKENPLKGANSYESLDEYIKKKCNVYYSNNYEPFKDTIYTLHGKLYEPIAARFYSINKNTKINDFGLITHPKLPWLAASPDGITDDGVMLEIKCPLSRKINTDGIPFGYWLQTQIQMEVCDLDECDFLECEISEITKQDFLDENDSVINEGLVGCIIKKEDGYIYPDENINNKELYMKFISVNEAVYYKINKWNIINLKRSKEWFKNIKKDLYEVYKRVQKYQNNKEIYDKYLESFSCPIYKKSLIKLDKDEIEYTEHITTFNINFEETEVVSESEMDYCSISCNISCDIEI